MKMTGTLESTNCIDHKESQLYLQLKEMDAKFPEYLSTMYDTNKGEAA